MALPSQRRDLQLLDKLPDAELVARILEGESALFELIMRRYNRRLFRITRGILGNDTEAEDAVQESYVCAWFKLSQFRGPAGFASWLCQIATNEALMRRRRHRNMQRTELCAADELADEGAVMSDLHTPGSGPGVELHELQLRQLLENVIDKLPDVYRETFVLREVEQMSVAETARCLGIEEGAVKTRVHRARKLLQRNLTAELSAALTGTFDFDGARCDRVVATVLQRIHAPCNRR